MAAYTIINSTGSALGSGGVTTAAHTIETGVTLTDSNLAIVAALNGVAVMQDAPTAAEKAAVGNELLGGGAGVAPGVSYIVANGSASALTDIDGSTDIPVGEVATVTLTPLQLVAAQANEGVTMVKASLDNEERRKAAKILRLGRDPGTAIVSS
jgi:hypothetical protein